jgi:dCMP deaminase
MRDSWDIYFLKLADSVSERATCKRAKCGCVITKDNCFLSSGYNGAPPGIPHCTDHGYDCIMIDGHCERCNHAEVNAVCLAAMNGISIKDSTAYITGEPCHECLRTLACSGIKKLV